MSGPLIFIVGVPHTGTTWIASLLQACGYNLTGNLKHANGTSARHGNEWWPSWHLFVSIHEAIGAGNPKTAPNWWKISEESITKVRNDYGESVKGLDWPQIVKYPGHEPSYLWDLIDPGFVIITTRDSEAWLKSTRKESKVAGLSGDQMVEATKDLIIRTATSGYPYIVLPFEASVSSPENAWLHLQHVPGLSRETVMSAHRRITRPSWVTGS